MALRIGDRAPDFTAETTQGRIRFMTGSATPGACCFPIRRTSLPSAPRSSATSRACRSSRNETAK